MTSVERERAATLRRLDAAAELKAQLERLLDEVHAGRVDAAPVERARIEGAVVALDVVLGANPDDIVARVRPGTGGI